MGGRRRSRAGRASPMILLPLVLLLNTARGFVPVRPPATSTLASPSSRPRSSSRTISPRMSAASAPAATPAATPAAVTRSVVQLPTGLSMEVLIAGPATATKAAPAPSESTNTPRSGQQNPLETFFSGLMDAFNGSPSPAAAAKKPPAGKANKRPPLVFVHGSFHSAWCWAEHFLPFFAEQGYTCYAISCRGTSQSPDPDPATKAIKIKAHAADLRAFLDTQFPAGSGGPAPIVIGHSFGGAILNKLLEQDPSNVKAGVWLCSVPPSGNGPMTSRFLKRDFILALKIVLGFVAKKGAEWDWLARELFFDAGLDAGTLGRYKARLKADSVVGIDVKDFLAELPSLKVDPATGQATWVKTLPRRLVVGAEQDNLVDREGVEEMASFADAGAPVFLPLAHDVMLVTEWRTAAQALLDWLGRVD